MPARSRRVFGEYYTPPGLAELGVDAVAEEVDDVATVRVVDPGCGAGAFLTAALRRKRDARREDESPTETIERLTATVVGVDLNPVAVAAARTAYLLALLPVVERSDAEVDRVSLPVFLGDALGLAADAPTTGVEGAADVLLGNPPWIPWERLPDAQKRRLREGPIDRLNLFDYEGASARLGHANDDLSLPFVWTCLDRYLADDGVAAFVLKRDHLRGPAGRLVRSGRVGSRPLSVERVHDFAAVDPFDGVDAGAALYLFRVGSAASGDGAAGGSASDVDPVPTTVWEPTDRTPDFGSLRRLRATLTRTETALEPVDPDDRAGPWHRTDSDTVALGECRYRIRHGLKDDAKAVFSVDADLLDRIEPDHVYPYLRSKHVVKWGLFGHDRFLVPQRQAGEDNEEALARETPTTYDYLRRNRDRLAARGSSWFDSGPFYSLFGLGPYTWAPYKLVWCRLGFKPHFAVVSTVADPELGEKRVVPGDHCMFVACDDEREAHYLCALLNAAPYQRCLRELAGGGKAGLSKSVVSSLALPEWEGKPWQERLADRSLRAHEIVPWYTDRSKRAYNELSIPELARVEHEVDAIVTAFLEEA
ncbi:N-6 DNA methylase [Salinigranum sp. GCM10025319]|uniref:N-6 DNA methylase n=1 Tax=Salinigranum sp. GCM10025319 TaxID=3252687 RepID=UPI003609C9DB